MGAAQHDCFTESQGPGNGTFCFQNSGIHSLTISGELKFVNIIEFWHMLWLH